MIIIFIGKITYMSYLYYAVYYIDENAYSSLAILFRGHTAY